MKFTHLCRNPLGLKASGTGSRITQAANFTSLHPVCKLASPQKSSSFSAQCKHTINLEVICRSGLLQRNYHIQTQRRRSCKTKGNYIKSVFFLKMKKSYHWLHWFHVHRKGMDITESERRRTTELDPPGLDTMIIDSTGPCRVLHNFLIRYYRCCAHIFLISFTISSPLPCFCLVWFYLFF